MNRRIKAHFQYGWWIYLFVFVAVVVFWVSVFHQLAKNKDNEELNITIVGSVDDSGMAEDILTALEGQMSTALKEVNVEVVSGTNAILAEIVAMRCLGDTDIIIFEEDYLVTPLSLNFTALDGDKLDSYFGGITAYTEDGNTYGMLLYDGVTSVNFTHYYSGDKKFWAFITPVSKNAAALNGQGAEEDDAALRAIKYLTGAV